MTSTILEFGSFIRLFVSSHQEPAQGNPGYVAGYFLDTQLPPCLVIKENCNAPKKNLIQPYSDLTQSLYFKIETVNGAKMQKGVEFGEQFRLVPYNALNGQEVREAFQLLVPGSQCSLSEHRFTFTKSTPHPVSGSATPSFTPAFLPQSTPNIQSLAQGTNDNFIRYNTPNLTLNVMRSPSKSAKNGELAPFPIEFAKDKTLSLTGGVLSSEKSLTLTPKSEPLTTKPLTFSVRSAIDPLITVQVYDAPVRTAGNNSPPTKPAEEQKPLDPADPMPPLSLNQSMVMSPSQVLHHTPAISANSTLLSDVPVHAFHQNHIVYTGSSTERTVVIKLRDVGKVTLSMDSLGEIPLNSFYNKIAPPTTQQEWYEWDDEHAPENRKETQRTSMTRLVKLHGAQLSVQLPISVTKIAAGSEVTKTPFQPNVKSDTFLKLTPPPPSPIVSFLGFFALSYRIFVALQTGLFQQSPLEIFRALVPFVFLALLSIFYTSIPRNRGHSVTFTSSTPTFHYIMKFHQPQDLISQRDVQLAYSSPSPQVLSNLNINLGTPNPIPYSSAVFNALQQRSLVENRDMMKLNPQYDHDMKLQAMRSKITDNSLNLFQIIDTIRTSTIFTDGDLSPLAHTLPPQQLQAMEQYLNSNMVSYKGAQTSLKQLLKQITTKGQNPQAIAALITHDKNFSYKLSSAHWGSPGSEVKLYYPFLFNAIRLAHHIDPQDFINAWSFGLNNLPSAATGAGRSGAIFMTSSCGKYIFKTMGGADMATLHSLVTDYATYVTTHSSLLMRLLGVYRLVGADGKKQYFLVANNVFYLPPTLVDHTYKLVSKYDLKGRTPKLDADKRRSEADAGVWKDLQLSRVFCLQDSIRDTIAANLESDTEFLKAHDCIDYSLLVGVGENQNIASQLEGERPDSLDLTNVFQPTNDVSEYRRVGIPPFIPGADNHLEVFCVAIVDFLARYGNMMKKTAHAMKSLRWKDEELSTVNSQYYGQRFVQYTKIVFPPVGAVLVRTKEELAEYFEQEAQQTIDYKNGTPSRHTDLTTPLSHAPSSTTPNVTPGSIPSISLVTPRKSLTAKDNLLVSPEAKKIADGNLGSLPAQTLKAFDPGARSPGSMVVTRAGNHVVILPTGHAPRSLTERSKLGYGASDLSKLTTMMKSQNGPNDLSNGD